MSSPFLKAFLATAATGDKSKMASHYSCHSDNRPWTCSAPQRGVPDAAHALEGMSQLLAVVFLGLHTFNIVRFLFIKTFCHH